MPEYKAMYLYMSSLFAEGFITPENLAYKQDQQSVDAAVNGKAFALEWTPVAVENLNARIKTAGNPFQFVYLPIKINSAFKSESHNVGWRGVYILGQEYMKLQTQKPAIGLVVPEADTQEAVILANIQNMIPSEETKVFLATNQTDAAKAYDDMAAKANQMGLATLESWANTKYDSVKKLFQ